VIDLSEFAKERDPRAFYAKLHQFARSGGPATKDPTVLWLLLGIMAALVLQPAEQNAEKRDGAVRPQS